MVLRVFTVSLSEPLRASLPRNFSEDALCLKEEVAGAFDGNKSRTVMLVRGCSLRLPNGDPRDPFTPSSGFQSSRLYNATVLWVK